MSEYDIECVGLSKYYGADLVIESLDLKVRRGEFFSLLGPSGSGKSTILRMIAGFEPISGGVLRLRGEVANDVPPHKRGVGLVFQHLALFPHLSVGDNVAFGLRMKKRAPDEVAARVRDALRLMRLDGYEPRKITQLSGGERQRVALARALVTEPTVLLLDEPLTGLDYKLSLEMKSEFMRIHRETGTTFVYVTHDQTSALGISQRMAVLRKGKIVQIGTPEEVYENPATRFVADFIGNANILRGEFRDGMFRADGLALRVTDAMRHGDGWVSIKPERIRVGVASDGDNTFEGRVQDVVYQGSYYVLGVEVAEGTRLMVVTSHFTGAIGDRILLSWAPDDVVPLVD